VAQPWFGERPVRPQDRPARLLLRIPVWAPNRATVVELQTQPGGVSAAAGVVWVGANAGPARLDAAHLPPALAPVSVLSRPTVRITAPPKVGLLHPQAGALSAC
jgi:hypothetical protein